MNVKIGICGLGFVGGAMYNSFKIKGLKVNTNLFVYDKFKNGGIGNFSDILNSDILFLALPTPYEENKKEYNKDAIEETLQQLEKNNFKGVTVIKSTIEPEVTDELSLKYKSLQLIHNPEFLSAKTAFHDFHNQSHIVIGKSKNCDDNSILKLRLFYMFYYKGCEVTLCSALESETMKCFSNSFYAVKVQFFTEMYLTCKKNGSNFNLVKDMMIKNGWINAMHTNVPGPDGKISYGGLCFPKDTNALNEYMKVNSLPNNLLDATIKERNSMRCDDFINDLESRNV